MKKELRGKEAVEYATDQGLFLNIDYDLLLKSETALLGHPATRADLQSIAELGSNPTPAQLTRALIPLVDRHGEEFIYVPLEGNHPEEEERVTLDLYHRFLEKEIPEPGDNLLILVELYQPRLHDTGFPQDADLNLIYHAARRLVASGHLFALPGLDSGDAEPEYYGNRLFQVTADLCLPLEGLICESCQSQIGNNEIPHLHPQCARRLKEGIEKSTTVAA